MAYSILPQDNSLPETAGQAATMLEKIGLGYKLIYARIDGCALFGGGSMRMPHHGLYVRNLDSRQLESLWCQ